MSSPNLVFQAAPASAKPDPGALVFGEVGNFARGFQGTNFGEPVWVGHRVNGFKTSTVGIPRIGMRVFSVGAITKMGSPREVSLTQHQQTAAYATFGLPASRQFYTGAGFSTSHFGIASTILSASGACSTRLSTPSIPLLVSGTPATATFGAALSTKIQVASGIPGAMLGQGHRVAPIAVGFRATKVSIPSIPLRAIEIAPADTYGVPNGYLVQKAEAIHSTAFGLANVRQIAVGIAPLGFGVASGYQYFRVTSNYPDTAFGTPTSPTHQVCAAASNQTFSALGWPFAFSANTVYSGLVATANGWSPTAYSAATAQYAQLCEASGAIVTSMGSHDAQETCNATGFSADPQFGSPTPTLIQSAGPAASTTVGTPAIRLYFHAASAAPRLSFGHHAANRPGAAHAYGWYAPARIGRPTLYKPATYKAWQLNLGRRFGQPTARTA